MARSAPEKGKDDESFEQRLKRLEQLVASLEQGDLPLEAALECYEKGVAELRQCYQMLEKAETRMKALLDSPGGAQLTAIDPPQKEQR